MTNRNLSVGKDLAATFLLFIIAAALFSPLLFKPDTLIYNMDIDYFFAHEVVVEDSFVKGDFPLWNPYFGAGSPGLSKIQIGLFYPPMVMLRLLLPVVARLNWDVVLNVFIAGLGVYWLMRDLVTNRAGAIFSAIVFMLSGSIIPRVFAGHESVLHAVVWTGWLLFAYRRMLYRHSWWYLLLTVIFSAFVVLGGHPQMSAIVLLVPISYFIFVYLIENLKSQRWSELVRGFGLSLLVTLLTAGLTAAQLIPFVEWLSYTARGSGVAFDSFEKMSWHSIQLHHLITPFMPLAWFTPESADSINFVSKSHFWEISPFVGILTLFLIISGLILVRDQNWHLILYFMGLAIFGLVMSMGTYNPLYNFILDVLPYIRAPGRILLLWTFSLAILAGISLDGLVNILNRSDKRLLFIKSAYFITASSLIAIAAIVWWNFSDGVILAQLQEQGKLSDNDPELLQSLLQRSTIIFAVTLIIISGLFLSVRISVVKPKLWSWLAIVVVIFELVLFARPLVRPFPVNALFDPQNPLAKLEIDPGEVRIDGYRTPPNYLVPTLIHVKNGEEHETISTLLQDKEKGQKLLAASYFAEDGPIDDPNMELVQQKDSAFLYRHVNTSPRIYASDSISLVKSDEDALDFVLRDSFNQFEQSVLELFTEDESLTLHDLGLDSSETEEVHFSGEYLTYGNNRIVAQVTLDRAATVIFSELYFPGWQATVDGEPAAIWRTNYTLRGVIAEKGEHIIEMRYSPPSFQIGVTLSLVTMSAIILVSIWMSIKSTRQRRS